MENESTHKYDDIINLPHPVSKSHPPMPLSDRAAQFSPFAALTGYEAAMEETARLTDEKQLLSEDAIEKLNEKLRALAEHKDAVKNVTITYFKPDEQKNGGAYIAYSGIVKRIDEYARVVIMEDKMAIPIEQIREIEDEWG